ncbi:MAG: RNA methyltransferase, partial [Pseudomonadota bacterium]
ALDISESRLGRVRENLSRTGLSAKIVVADALKWAPEEPFDAILLDAPCSATGTIRRHPELPHRFLPKQLRELTRLQARLLERAFEWLTPSGCLVYCTCSLLKEEGEEQVEKFLQRHPALREDATLPGLEALFHQGHLRTRPDMWPERGHLDGFFAARLTRAT